ncbi:hypothetical protein [Thioalkalivibrio denitrificans]|nr:hypothetical protein [Thioalkalivibrio denitrificans]
MYRIATVLTLLLLASAAPKADEAAVNALLARDTPPPGVVFELVENDHEALQTLLPRIRAYISALRARHPDMGMAVVSHGNEQFSLTRAQRDARAELHAAVEGLVRDADVEVAVCATYAGWRDVSPEDFPDYVQVAESAPARINDFRALGYEVIRLRPPGADTGIPDDDW